MGSQFNDESNYSGLTEERKKIKYPAKNT